MTYVTTWMNLKNIILSEKSLIKKDHIVNVRRRKCIETESGLMDAWNGGWRRECL